MQNRTTALFLIAAVSCRAASLRPSAERAFESYVAKIEARLARQHARPETYLTALDPNSAASKFDRSSAGDVQVEPVNGGTWQGPGALVHHWRGTAFVPNATPAEMLAILRDFNHFPKHYAPEVVSARALNDNGETATLAVRFKEKRVLTVVIDGEYQVESRLSGHDRGYSASRSLHFW